MSQIFGKEPIKMFCIEIIGSRSTSGRQNTIASGIFNRRMVLESSKNYFKMNRLTSISWVNSRRNPTHCSHSHFVDLPDESSRPSLVQKHGFKTRLSLCFQWIPISVTLLAPDIICNDLLDTGMFAALTASTLNYFSKIITANGKRNKKSRPSAYPPNAVFSGHLPPSLIVDTWSGGTACNQ